MPNKRAVYDIAEFKALPDEGDDKGRFEAIVAVFGNVDFQGDRVVEGAFTKNLDQWRAKGAPIPIIWSHQWGDPNAHIGSANPDDVEEVKSKGLKVVGSIDLDNPFAAQVYRLLKERRVREFSFGYAVKKERPGKDGANELLELELIEVGPTLKGANPSTELLAVKSQLEDAAKVQKQSLGVKVYGTLAGSVEERQDRIREALREAFGGENVWVYVFATYDDRVVYMRQPDDGTTEYFEVSYTLGDDSVSFGSPTAVELTTTIRQKLIATEVKAGRSISSKNEGKIRAAVDALSEVLASLGDAKDEATSDDAEGTKSTAGAPPGVLELRALILNAHKE